MVAKKVTDLYQQQIKALPPEEQLQLLQLVAQGLADENTITPKKKRSILELEGLGAEIWEGIDAQEYVNAMRDEWDRPQ